MERHGIHVYHGGTRYKFERMQFAGGEEHVRFSWPPRLTVNDIVRIVAHIRSSSDLMTLLLLTDALRRAGAFHIVLLLIHTSTTPTKGNCMRRFELPAPTQVMCKKYQTRPEHHGDALITAMDLRVIWTTHSSSLDMLHPELRERFFSALPDSMGEQAEMDLAAEGLNFVRFKDLGYPQKWSREFTGWTLRIDYGLGEEGGSSMVVKLCKLHRFEFTPIEGGSTEIEWTISSSADIEGTVIAYLGTMQQRNITISLLAPNATENDEPIDASSGSGAPGTGPAADDAAPPRHGPVTEAFIAQHSAPATKQ